MTDLLYFGYTWDDGSKSLEQEFISEVKAKFPDVRIEDVYDDIKGYRQSVRMPEGKEDDYWAWMIAHGWMNLSLNVNIKMMGDKDEFDRIFDLAKQEYPECFKDAV